MRTVNTPAQTLSKDIARISSMFSGISRRYDLLNRILSGRRDVAWRNALAERHRLWSERRGLWGANHLDLATGTGDLLFTLLTKSPRISGATGIDISRGMLDVGQEKALKLGLHRRARFLEADAVRIPFPDQAFDSASIAFGIRNVYDVPACLREVNRSLKPEGKFFVLEFSQPRMPVLSHLYRFYFRHILPVVGGWLSGDRAAYLYLNRSVEEFPYGEEFLKLLKDAGFRDLKATSFSLGIATLYEGTKS